MMYSLPVVLYHTMYHRNPTQWLFTHYTLLVWATTVPFSLSPVPVVHICFFTFPTLSCKFIINKPSAHPRSLVSKHGIRSIIRLIAEDETFMSEEHEGEHILVWWTAMIVDTLSVCKDAYPKSKVSQISRWKGSSIPSNYYLCVNLCRVGRLQIKYA